ncbi:metallopeptidase TldD-related protein [Paraclostridium dentum]|uniref:metallopeptidase TldD-related protein n=1 Tax=Paraclostridium dentum TaxID=2662455 RepID=UPI001475F5B6|nr:metallopeptidase TldD-related protein [Paraclostridium dentum]
MEIKDIDETQTCSKKELNYPNLIIQLDEGVYTTNASFISSEGTINYKNLKKLNISNLKINENPTSYLDTRRHIENKTFNYDEYKILDWLSREKEIIRNKINEDFNIGFKLIYKQKINKISENKTCVNTIISKDKLTCEISIFTRKTYRFYNNKNIKLFSSIGDKIYKNLIKNDENLQEKELKGKYILENNVVIKLINIILESLSGERVLSEQSAFNVNLLNKKVFSSKLSIFQQKISPLDLDDEGMPISDGYLIKDGTLKNYIVTLEQSIILNQTAYGNCEINSEGKLQSKYSSLIVSTDEVDEYSQNIIQDIKILGIDFQNMNISIVANHTINKSNFKSKITTLNLIEFLNSAKEIRGTKSRVDDISVGNFIYEF